jgi:hypothetical protein
LVQVTSPPSSDTTDSDILPEPCCSSRAWPR